VAGFDRGLTGLVARLAKPARRDGAALGFGIAFIAFGVLGLLRAAGLRVDAAWLYPLIFVGLGVAGLAGALLRERR